jgi:hypothetical protein
MHLEHNRISHLTSVLKLVQDLRSYADHIVSVDAAAADQWGRLNVPDPLPVIDGLLAASARACG